MYATSLLRNTEQWTSASDSFETLSYWLNSIVIDIYIYLELQGIKRNMCPYLLQLLLNNYSPWLSPSLHKEGIVRSSVYEIHSTRKYCIATHMHSWVRVAKVKINTLCRKDRRYSRKYKCWDSQECLVIKVDHIVVYWHHVRSNFLPYIHAVSVQCIPHRMHDNLQHQYNYLQY